MAAPEEGTLAMSPIFNLAEPSGYKGWQIQSALKNISVELKRAKIFFLKAIIGQRLLTTKMVTERISAKGL